MIRQGFSLQGMTQTRPTTDLWVGRSIRSGAAKMLRCWAKTTCATWWTTPTSTGRWLITKPKGSKIEYIGHDVVDGDDAYKLKVTLKNGDVMYYYLDPGHLPGDQASDAGIHSWRCAGDRGAVRFIQAGGRVSIIRFRWK